MEQTTVMKALEDLEVIKGVIQRTSTSLTGFSRALLWWGGAWLALVVLLSLLSTPLVAIAPRVSTSTASQIGTIAYLLTVATFAVLVIGVGMGISTYRQAARNAEISMLTRGLISVWGLVIAISFLFPILFALVCALQQFGPLSQQILQSSIGASASAGKIFSAAGLFTPYAHAMEIWFFALALFVTRAFTRISFAGWLAAIFLLIGLLYPLLGEAFGNYFHPGPFALLLLGGYLEMRRPKEGV